MYTPLKKISRILFTGLLSGILFFSCEKENESKILYRQGAFIINEGAFTGNNGSVSFYSFISDSVHNDIFYQANNSALGDVVQSMSIFNGKAYIVVNNSNKVEVVDTPSFESSGVIEGVLSPRYFIADGNYGYLSCWGDNSVKVIDLNSNSVTSSITVASGPEKMCLIRNKLYVANTGGWATDSIISVIDLSSNEVVAEIEVKYTPTDMVIDSDSNIWVLCYGKIVYGTEDPYPILEESPSKIYRIDTENDRVTAETILFEHEHPAQLEINSEGDLFFGGGYTFNGIYSFNTADFTNTLRINEFVYGLNVASATDEIYVTIAPTYTSAGTMKRFSKEYSLLGTYLCGIGPNSVVF